MVLNYNHGPNSYSTFFKATSVNNYDAFHPSFTSDRDDGFVSEKPGFLRVFQSTAHPVLQSSSGEVLMRSRFYRAFGKPTVAFIQTTEPAAPLTHKAEVSTKDYNDTR